MKHAFDDSDRCAGCTSGITGHLRAICITCSRLTLRTTGPLIKGQVYRDTMGTSDCKDWKAHEWNVRPVLDAGNPYALGGTV